MAKQRNLHDRLVAALLARGGVVIDDGVRRKRTTIEVGGARYHVGKSGGMRCGDTVVGSTTMKGTRFYRALLAEQPADVS